MKANSRNREHKITFKNTLHDDIKILLRRYIHA